MSLSSPSYLEWDMKISMDFAPALEWFLHRAAGMSRKTNRRLADVIGLIWHRIDSRHRRIVLGNLERAWGDELDEGRRRVLCRKVFTNLARVFLEFPYLTTLRNDIDGFMTFSGYENVARALAKKKGLLMMASHFGNWEVMSLGCSYRHMPFNVVVRPLDNPQLDKLVNAVRSAGGNRIIPKKGSVREVLRVLHRRGIVALLVDQNVDWYDGVFVPFFKDIACTNKALAVLALRTGAPVIPIHNVREHDGRYRVIFGPEVPLIRTGDTTSDIEENTALFNRIIEGYVRLNPDHWFWVHQRWKTRPFQPWPRMTE